MPCSGHIEIITSPTDRISSARLEEFLGPGVGGLFRGRLPAGPTQPRHRSHGLTGALVLEKFPNNGIS